MTQSSCDKTNTLPKMKNFAEDTMICIHILVRNIALEINNEMEKIQAQKNPEWRFTTMSRYK